MKRRAILSGMVGTLTLSSGCLGRSGRIGTLREISFAGITITPPAMEFSVEIADPNVTIWDTAKVRLRWTNTSSEVIEGIGLSSSEVSITGTRELSNEGTYSYQPEILLVSDDRPNQSLVVRAAQKSFCPKLTRFWDAGGPGIVERIELQPGETHEELLTVWGVVESDECLPEGEYIFDNISHRITEANNRIGKNRVSDERLEIEALTDRQKIEWAFILKVIS